MSENKLSKEAIQTLSNANEIAKIAKVNLGIPVLDQANDPKVSNFDFLNTYGTSKNSVTTNPKTIEKLNSFSQKSLPEQIQDANVIGKKAVFNLFGNIASGALNFAYDPAKSIYNAVDTVGNKVGLDLPNYNLKSTNVLENIDPNRNVSSYLNKGINYVNDFIEQDRTKLSENSNSIINAVKDIIANDELNKYKKEYNKAETVYDKAKATGKNILNNVIRNVNIDLKYGSPTEKIIENVADLGSLWAGTKVFKTNPVAVDFAESSGELQRNVQNDILNAFYKDLANNPRFNKLISEGKTQEQAKTILASELGAEASVLGSPGSFLTSKILPDELNIKGNISKNITDILKSTGEEVIQSVNNTVTKNLFNQSNTNPNTYLAENVGRNIADEAYSSILGDTAIRTPNLVGSTLKEISNIQENRSDSKNPNGEKATQNAINKLNNISTNEPTQNNNKNYIGSEFDKSLLNTEGGNYKSDNNLDGYDRAIGKVQFIANRLKQLQPKLNGLVTDNDFTVVKDKNGKNSYRYTPEFIEKFKNNENGIQDLANKAQYETLDEETKPYEKYIGKTINGVEITKSGLMASAHLGGIGGLKNFLTGKSNAKDANGTSIAEYMQKHGNKSIYTDSSLQTVTNLQNNKISKDINTINDPINQSTEQIEKIKLTPEQKQQDVLQVVSKEDNNDQFINNLLKNVKNTIKSSKSKPEAVKRLITDIKSNVYTDKNENNSAKLLALSEYDNLVNYVAEAEDNETTNAIKTIISNTAKDIESIRESIEFPDDFSLNHKDFDTTFKFAKVSPSKVSINYLNKLFDGSNESNDFLKTMKSKKVETLKNLYEQNKIINDNLLSINDNVKNTAKVSQEIRDTGFNDDQNVKKSLNKHLDDFNIITSGGTVLNKENQPVTLEETVQGIQNFALHMKGKAEAITESANTKNNPKIKYPVWNGKKWYSKEETTNEGVYHNPNSLESTANNAMIFSDAYRTIRTFNSIAKKYNKMNKENQLSYITLPDAPKDIKNYSNKLNKSFSEQQKEELNYYSGSDNNIRKTQKFIEPTAKKESDTVDVKKKTKPLKAKKTSVKKDSLSNTEKNLTNKADPIKKIDINKPTTDINENNNLTNKVDEITTKLVNENNEFNSEEDRQNYINEKIIKDLVGKDIFDNYIYFNKNITSLKYILTQIKDNQLTFFNVFVAIRKNIINKLNEAVNVYNTKTEFKKNPEFHVLNFTKFSNNKLQYNEEIINKALLGFSLWFSDLNPEDPRFYNNMIIDKNSETEKVFINDTKDESLGNIKTYFSKENIAKDLTKYISLALGINFKDNTPLIITGIIESLAKEILIVISQEKTPLIKFINESGQLLSDPKKKPTLIKIDKEVLIHIKENITNFNKNSKKSGINILKDILNANELITYSVGSPIENKSNTVKNSKNVLSKKQKQQLDKLNSVPNYLNKELFNVFKEISSNQKLFDKFKTLFVRIPKNMNENTKKTIIGKQQTLLDNMFNMFSIATEIDNLDVDTPVYIKHEINTTGRADAGLYSGQSNKMIREILNPNKSTFDLNNEELKDFYLMSIAQALGAKTEYKSKEESKQYVRDFFNNNKELINASRNKDYETVVNILLNQDEITEIYFHAVIDLGRYINALNNKDKEFTTSIYLESDGKTDGPGNLLANFDPFPITIDSLKRLAKVGYFIGSDNKTLADYYQEDNIDLYKESVDKLSQNNNSEVKLALEMFATLGLDVTLNTDDTITIDRGFGKSPVTVVGYGSEVNGLSKKLVNSIIDEIYNLMTEYLNTKNEKIKEKIYNVTVKINYVIKNYNESVDPKNKVSYLHDISKENFVKFTFTPVQIQSLVLSLKSFAQSFMDVIKGNKGILGNTTPVMDLVKNTTQLQSLFAQEVFKQKINEYIETKTIAGRVKKYPKETLTLKVLNDIFKELQADGILPEYKSDLINLYIGYTEKIEFDVESSDSLPRSNGKTNENLLLGSYTTGTQINGPEDAGVSGIPIINIGTGDALMMLNAFVNDLVTNALNVYDGLNSGINDVKSNSQGINQAVYMGYQTDHLKPLIENIEKFIKAINNKYKNVKIIYNNKNKNVPITAKILTEYTPDNYDFALVIKNVIQNNIKSLIDFNQRILAKKKVLNRIISSIDHMASANVPYIIEPENPIYVFNLDQKQLVNKINEEINKELGIEPINENKPLIIKSLKDLQDLIPEKNLNNELKDAYKILKDNINTLSDSNIEISEIDQISDDVKEIGRYTPKTNTIHIRKDANNDSVTLIHELLHGLTVKKIYFYYNNEKRLSKKDFQALEVIEKQMYDFIEKNPNSLFVKKIYIDKKENIPNSNLLNLGEFITYVLTEKPIQKEAKQTQTSLSEKIINKVKTILKNVFGLTSEYVNVYDVVLVNTDILLKNEFDNAITSDVYLSHISNEDIDMGVSLLNISKNNKTLNNINETIEFFNIQNKFNELTNVGFKFTEEQSIKFIEYLTVFNKAVLANNNIINSMNKIFSKIIENLTVEDFLNTSKNMIQAKEQYDLITNITDINSFGSILGLYQLNENFANAIKDISLKKKLNRDQSIDRLFEDLASTGIDLLNGVNRQPTVGKSLEMINQIVQTTKPRKELYNIPNNYLSQANKKVYDTINDYLKLLASKSSIFSPIEAIYNKELSLKYTENVINGLNKSNFIPLGFKELAKEFIGKIPLTAEIENMLKLVKSQVQAVRQGILVELPKILANNFKNKMKLSNWSTLYNTIGISDILSINDNVFDTIEMIKNNNVLEQIKLIEKKLDPKYIKKCKQLANFIINKEEGNNLLRNSYAIGRLLNETDELNSDPSEDIIKLIDDLVSLYAYELLNDDVKKDFNDIITNDREAVEYLANTVKEIQKKEKEKSLTGYAKYTHLKGYLPENIKDNKRIIIAEDINYKELIKNGYTRIGDYNNDSEKSIIKSGYYYSDVIGSGYVSGVLQTIHQSANGVDPVTGKMLSHRVVNKLITGTYVNVLNKKLSQYKSKNSGFIPVFDANGKLYAYERVIDKEVLNKLNPDEELHKVIAILKGRQEEEKLAEEFNKILIDRAFELKEKDYENNKDSYINLSTSTDPIHQDIWNVIPKTTKQYINKVFGKNQFYIRKELLNNMVGYRVPSVQDLFTGKSRFDKKTQQAFQKLVMTIFGDKAFKYLSIAEKGIQSVVGFTKESIVVKSIAVPVMNFLANIVELSSFGVSIPDIRRYMLEGFTDLNTHIKNNKRKLKIQSDLLATNDPTKIDKLNKELQSINVIENNLKIKPLLDAGEFNTIVEEADIGIDDALKNNNISDWIENTINKLPQGIKTIARYAVLSKNTALYKGLSRSIQYGDFLSKYVLYQYTKKDEQTKNPLLTKDQIEKIALEQISEAFVDYNFNSGRIGTGLDLYGLTWFKTYRIRITKIALRLMRDKPVTTLLSTLLGTRLMPVGTGSLLEDNIFEGINTNGWNNIINELSQPNMLKLF